MPATPTVNTMIPTAGHDGTVVTVTGANLDQITAVTVGGVTTRFAVIDPQTLAVVAPLGPAPSVPQPVLLSYAVDAYEQAVLAANPVSYWRTAETGGTVAADQMGVGNGTYTGTYTLAQPGPAQLGACAVTFTGAVNSYINFGNLAAYQIGAGTILSWVKTIDTTAGFTGVLVKQYAGSLFNQNGNLACFDWTNSVTMARGSIADGVWHLVALRFNSGVAGASSLWLDGAQAGASFQWSIKQQTSPLAAAAGTLSAQFLKGSVARPAIFATLLSDTVLADLYSKGH
jgi:hypothetical protein